MRKIQKTKLLIATFLSIVGAMFLVQNVDISLAENCPEGTVFCGKEMDEVLDDVKENTDGIIKSDNLILVILGWISFILPYAGLLAFVGIIYAGFLYVTGFAEEGNIEKAKNILMWSVIGLILIFMAYAIVSTFIKPTG